MQPPQNYQHVTPGGLGPNISDAVAVGYAHENSPNETKDSVPKAEDCPNHCNTEQGKNSEIDDMEERFNNLMQQ